MQYRELGHGLKVSALGVGCMPMIKGGNIIYGEDADPIEAIKFRMAQANLSVKDLVPYIGPPNRVYEVLTYKRSLSLNMIRRLSEGLQIPAEVLIREADRVAA